MPGPVITKADRRTQFTVLTPVDPPATRLPDHHVELTHRDRRYTNRRLCAGCRWRVRRGRAEQNGQFWHRLASAVVLLHQDRIAYGTSG